MGHINLLLADVVVATFTAEPLEHGLKVPNGCTTLVNGRPAGRASLLFASTP
jgi:hypothetical protein